MTDLKQSQFLPQQYAEHNRRSADTSLRKVGAVPLVVGLALWCLQTATAQHDPSGLQRRKAELEVQKLELEVAKLQEEHNDWNTWLTAFLGVLTGVAGTAATLWAARRARAGAMDQATHEKRLESYPHLVKATSRLAVYFPGDDLVGTASVGPNECGAMGREMSKWYFEGGGLLLSVPARDAYFRLARALTRASLAKALKVPKFPSDAEYMSNEKVEEYCETLKQDMDMDDVEKWTFGSSPSETQPPVRRPHVEFKDYVFLQRLSSLLRKILSEDLRSRRRPS